mmetsp:Transcript_115572/g.222715  ORF Transcript_115572/g.222715 Transcript_115572/m.222715 type:complete len:656 (+) Transcript_115572:88-2055(+)
MTGHGVLLFLLPACLTCAIAASFEKHSDICDVSKEGRACTGHNEAEDVTPLEVDTNSVLGSALLATKAVRSKTTDPVPQIVHQEGNISNKAEVSFKVEQEPVDHGEPYPDRPPLQDPADVDYVLNDDGPWLFRRRGENETAEAEEEVIERKHVLSKLIVGPLALVLLLTFTVANVMEKLEVAAIPESAIMICIGVLLGMFLKMYAHFEFFDTNEAFSRMNSTILNLLLLPIIIFSSSWSLRRQDFFSQFPYILLFAIVGVAISTFVVGGLIYWTGSLDFHSVKKLRTAFAFASLISATDPVSTLSTYSKLKVDPLLNILVFGESTINDAVAIVLFNVFNSDTFMVDKHGESLTGWEMMLSVTWGVGKIFLGSLSIGVASGMGYSLIAHAADMRRNKKGQILVIFVSCYLTYAIAETVGMSGIIANMFSGILMGIYMRPHLSAEGSLLATFFLQQVAMLADACVFLLVGLSVVQLTSKGWYFGLWVMLFCLVGRFASTFPVGFLVNFIKEIVGTTNGIPREGWNLLGHDHMFMMWHAGLRGAIALALSLELGRWVDVVDGEGTRRALQTATFLVICVFLILFGGTTAPVLRQMGIPINVDAPADALSKTEDFGPLRNMLKWVDHTLLSPMLIGRMKHAPGEDERDVEDLLKDVHRW